MNKLRNIKINIAEIILLKYINNIKYFFSNKKIEQYKNDKKIIITLLPSHGNLGDHAIAEAAYKFYCENFKEYKIIQLDMSEIYEYGRSLKKVLNNDDFIVLLGGGNMNNLYRHEEWTRRFVIKNFKGINIVSMPQTISFTTDKNGQKELEKSKKIYNNNNKLAIYAREEKSYELMSKYFNNKIFLIPDIVFYLENMKRDINIERKGILTCLRSDKESYISDKSKNDILKKLKEEFRSVEITDTVINKSISKDTRKKELEKIWGKFFAAEVVITDRLHGMIFAVITKTPCIVIRNSDHKIIESYKWVKDLNYIRLIDDFSYKNVKTHINELSLLDELSETNFKEKFLKNIKAL